MVHVLNSVAVHFKSAKEMLKSKLDALNLTQMIKEPTRYNPKSINMGTRIDIILTNLPSKYTSAVFNQDFNDHFLIACIRYGPRLNDHPSSLSNAP